MSKFDDLFGQYNSKLYMRYVDDIITTIKRINIPRQLTTINKWHKNLKFTCEEEDDQGCISFLDMKLHHTRDKIESSWYMKPTNSGLTLNYHAVAPIRFKRSVVRSFVYRIYNACSNWKYFDEGIK